MLPRHRPGVALVHGVLGRQRLQPPGRRLEVVEHLREYQDYVLAYRLRALIGGRLRPSGPQLSLAAYAARRLRRQALARQVTASDDYRTSLREVERLTDELSFGVWHNPSESVRLLEVVVRSGGCRALESEAAFAHELLTPTERARAGAEGVALLARYYLGLLRASSAYLDAVVFDRLRSSLDAERDRLPVVVSDLGATAADDA